MAYVIGIVLVLIASLILGLILRKRVYDEVDRLEGWKMDIMNRPVTERLSKVKSLNLSGETQEKFESWKERWDYILTRELPDMEEYLFDAEEAADRYRFPTSKKNLKIVGDTLYSIEVDIEKMFKELEQLLDSEENSRKEMEGLQPKVKAIRNKLLQNRHQYGKAENRYIAIVGEIEKDIANYYELTESGNYFEAQSLVAGIKEKIIILEQTVADFPGVYKQCKQDLPSQINELLAGIKEMKSEGYRIEHLGFEKELHKNLESLQICVSKLEDGETEEAIEVAPEIEDRIKEMYQLLENEAVAKKHVEAKLPNYLKSFEVTVNDFGKTKGEVESLQEAYYFEDSDMELRLTLEKWITHLRKQSEEIQENANSGDISYLEIRDKLDQSVIELGELSEKHEEFKEQLQTLRKDEIEAKEKIIVMRKQLYDTNRKLQKSNIPGVPSYIWEQLEVSKEKSNKVVANLEKQPLDMGEVQYALTEAENAVQTTIDQTELLLDQAHLAELVIQYANRYRSQYGALAENLASAEKMFRAYDYENALEKATRSLEEVEPGAIQRLEEFSKVPS